MGMVINEDVKCMWVGERRGRFIGANVKIMWVVIIGSNSQYVCLFVVRPAKFSRQYLQIY